ncbi:hypothetical protein JXA84_00635 [candidate division WOR-3 bacterium]|nr:hypothetical protein [candidate division WOR-3 bacterium]
MGKAYKILLDITIVILGILLVFVLVFPQQKALRAEMKFREARTNLYTVRKAIEKFMYEKSESYWDETKGSWVYSSQLPESKDDIISFISPSLSNPFSQRTAEIQLIKAESSLVETRQPLPVRWDTADGGQWVYDPSEEVLSLWRQAGNEQNMPKVLDDSIIISIDPSTQRVRYDAWEGGDKTPSLSLSLSADRSIFYLDTIPPESQDEFSGWLFNFTIADYLVSNRPQLPSNFESIGAIKINYVWPDPPELETRRGQRKPDPRDSVEVEKPFISYSYYEYSQNSFKPSFIDKDDDSDTSWIAGRTSNPGDIQVYVLPPKYCIIAFGEDGKPITWEDPGKHKHVLILWQAD